MRYVTLNLLTMSKKKCTFFNAANFAAFTKFMFTGTISVGFLAHVSVATAR